ncbi:MAG: Peroxide stress regulator PerR, family [Myxococcaceae bacterium]|jgi:Fur family peroxide stress response transcriptional regulator|nr:Peroxide stress regulator PerR, family [Myxococcaceae bacterium]MEA2747438.1 Fur family transcriptional regulator, peroxide stress response regulator [Myxococcales bacterium]
MTGRADKMLADLKRAGLKLTPQRIAIVRELADDLSHPTAQALFERLRPAYPTMSFATVYSTLDVLVGKGLAGSLNADQGSRAVRFDPNVEPHHHAICDACGCVLDIPLDNIPLDGPVPTAELEGFRVLREERTYRGLCHRCT